MYIRACNATNDKLKVIPLYQKLSTNRDQAWERLLQALPENQRHLAEEWFEAEAAAIAEFDEALFIRGMQYGAKLATLILVDDIDEERLVSNGN